MILVLAMGGAGLLAGAAPGPSPDPSALIVNVIVAVVAASGAWLTTFIQARSKAKETQQFIIQAARDDKQLLIDQIQEERNYQTEQRRLEREQFAAELKAERQQLAEERRVNGERIDRFWADKAASREYVARLQHHIWNRLDPPPPEPPAGYIP